MIKNKKILFWGSSYISIPFFKALFGRDHNIVGLITGYKTLKGTASDTITNIALENKIQVFQPEYIKENNDFFTTLSSLEPDLSIIISYGKILPLTLINMPIFGSINVHFSLLPKYRGPSPIQNAILNGDTETGVSLIKIDEKVDHGPVIIQKKISISTSDTYKTLTDKLSVLGIESMLHILDRIFEDTLDLKQQRDQDATYTKMLFHSEGILDPKDSTVINYNKIRALNPEPGTFMNINDQSFKILKAHLPGTPLLQHPQMNPGGFFKYDNELGLQFKDGFLIIDKIQKPGGKLISGKEFLNGYRGFIQKAF